MNKKEKIYTEAGGHTFFVPVEEGFKVRIIDPKKLLMVFQNEKELPSICHNLSFPRTFIRI